MDAFDYTSHSAQFTSFIDLVQYLMKQANHDFVFDKYDDPNTKINKFILALKVLGFPLDFPASKLRLSYGEAVCSALDFMCDKALAARNFGWTRPSYPKEDFADEAEVDEDAEVDADEEIPVEEEEEELYSNLARAKGGEESELEQSFQQMIISEVCEPGSNSVWLWIGGQQRWDVVVKSIVCRWTHCCGRRSSSAWVRSSSCA